MRVLLNCKFRDDFYYDKHFIRFSLAGVSYSARVIFLLNDRPILVDVTDLYPNDYKPRVPYRFIAIKENRLLLWPVENTNDADFGEAIAREIYKKAGELGIDLYA